MDYYKILEVDSKTSNIDIKKSYRRLAMQFHPDKNKDDKAADRFKQITSAYQTLSNPQKKLEYDRRNEHTRMAPFNIFEQMFNTQGISIYMRTTPQTCTIQKSIRTEIGCDGKVSKVTTIKQGNKITIIRERNGRIISQDIKIQ